MAGRGDQELKAMEVTFKALNELPVESQQRVLEYLKGRLGIGPGGQASGRPAPASAAELRGTMVGAVSRSVTPRSFLGEKKPEKAVERVACLAYFLTHHRAVLQFKTKDLTALNREAGYPALGNAAMAVNNATKQSQFLAPAGGGMKQITIRGEALVEALPDRERVKEALEANPLVGRKRRRPRK